MLSTLLHGGMPLVPSLETAGASMSSRTHFNGIQRRRDAGARRPVAGQEPGRTEVFPGSVSGNDRSRGIDRALPAMLNSVAEFYEEDVQTALGAAMALIEPMILIIMAVFVGGVLISLYLPIFTLGIEHPLIGREVVRHGEAWLKTNGE